MSAITIEKLSKCYRGGRKLKAFSSMDRFRALLEVLGMERFSRRPARSERKKASKYGEIWALRDVTLSVEEGTVLGIIGRNGAGKTTLLKVLSRITPPTSGRAMIRGRVVPLLEIGTGFNPALSGRENVFLNAAIHGHTRRDVARRLDAIVSFAELERFIDLPLRHYSSGMYLRLAFATAIHMDAGVLLADEVLAVADIGFQERCLQRIEEEGAAGRTILFVSHDMDAILRLAKRAIRLDEGRIVDEGGPEEVVARYQNALFGPGAAGRLAREAGADDGKSDGILSVRLLSTNGKEIGAARVSDDLVVKIVFRLSEPGAAARCGIDVLAREVHVFRSMQPDELRVETPGLHAASVRIPANLLSETVYTINASVNLEKKGRESAFVERSALSFQVYDADESRSTRGTYRGRLPGVISPRLEWTAERLEEALQHSRAG